MKKQMWKSMWMCLCIVFGCWMLALTANVQVHATVNNDVSTGETVGESDSQNKESVDRKNTTIDQKSADTNVAKESDTTFEPNAQGVYEIDSYAKLKQFATVVNEGNTEANAKLTADIECKNAAGTSATDWTPIGDSSLEKGSFHGYAGTFDGQDHTITGLNNTDNPTELGGLFSAINGGTVKNVVLKDAKLKGKDLVGGIVGSNSGIVQNCCNIGGTIGIFDNSDGHGNIYVGGIVGYNYSTVKNCYNTGDVTVVAFDKNKSIDVGGVVGFNTYYGKVENCYNTGNITASGQGLAFYVGGVLGYNLGTVECCYNTGNVSATDFGEINGVGVGGVLSFSSGVVKNCYNTGKVNVSNTSACEATDVGGVTGSNYGVLQNCYNAGNMSVKPNSLSKETYVGGVAGTGGVEGYAVSVEKNCYYDSSICKVAKAVGDADDTTTGKLTTAQMTGTDALENMKGFSDTDASNVWFTKADAKDGDKDYWFYPHLKGFNMKADGNQQMDPADIAATVWPPKVRVNVAWSEKESYVYNGSDQKPKVTSVTVGDDLVLEAEKDYTVVYQQQNGTEWKTVKVCVNAGTYKVSIAFKTRGHADIEKKFVIDPAPLMITADSASKVYDNTALSKDSYTSTDLVAGDKIASVKVTGSQTAIGSSDNVPSAAVIKNAAGEDVTANYDITYVNGDLTVTKQSVDPSKSDDKTNDNANDNVISSDTHSSGTNYVSDSATYKTSDVISAKVLFGLELLMMLSIMGLWFSRRKMRI